MRKQYWLLAVVALALLVGQAHTSAGAQEVVVDKGQNVYLVDSSKGELNNLLSAEEVEKIRRLQNEDRSVGLVSPISPDDQAALAHIGDRLGFLNVQDGSFAPLGEQLMSSRFVPIVSLLGFTPWGWRDDRTLVGVGVEQLDASGNEINPAIVSIDRLTGEIDGVALPRELLAQTPVSLAPNGSRLLLLDIPEPDDQSLSVVRAQVSWPRAVGRAAHGLPAGLRQRAETYAARSGYGRRLLALRPLLDPEDEEMAAAAKPTRLLAFSLADGETQELRGFEPGIMSLGFAWSQDGARLAASFLGALDYRAQPEPRDGRQPFDGALLSEQIYRDVTGNLPPAENPLLQRNTVEIFDMNGAGDRTLRAAEGDGQLLRGMSWSTDGQTLLVQAYQPGRLAGRRYPIYTLQFLEESSFRFYNFDLQEIKRVKAPQLAAATAGQFISPDEVLFTTTIGTNVHPYYYNRVSGEFRNLGDRAGTYSDLQATRLSRQIVFQYSSFTSPPEVYRLNWDGTAFSQLSWANEELRQFSKIRQDPVSFGLANRQTRAGVLIQPADAPFPPRDARIIVWQEGGPGIPMTNEWAASVENPYALLPNLGMAVLVVPLSGRYGLGPRTYSALYDKNNFGQLDIDEQAQIVRQMIAKHWTSKGKVGITGCSYGGYFTLQSLVRHPDLYAAANAQCAILDNVVEWSRGYSMLMPYIEGVPPWTADKEYRNDSPIYNAGRISTPLLTFHGTNDFLPITQNENMHLQLVNRNVPAKMLEFVGAGHGLVRDGSISSAYELYAAQEQILWFREHLK
ncbi:MAG TPA: prolyl oligopeptidase family serine peptidase [Roseiflexaceae bacterium]|nr:prolyl oligopeptidase family serine peptidase [Roseiflexaceae bacterium]